LASKGKNPKPEKDKTATPEKDAVKPDPAPKKAAPPAEKPEAVPSGESLHPTLAPSPKPKKDKNFSGLWGILLLFFLVLAGGIGGGGYYLYQVQKKFENEALAKLAQLEAQLSALDTEADQARQNKQSIDAVNQELQQFKTEMNATLKTHQSSLATLDEDVMRLKEKVDRPAGGSPMPSSSMDGTGAKPELLPGELLQESLDAAVPEDAEDKKDDAEQESKNFIDWMENFFAAIWHWIVGLFK